MSSVYVIRFSHIAGQRASSVSIDDTVLELVRLHRAVTGQVPSECQFVGASGVFVTAKEINEWQAALEKAIETVKKEKP